jgi:hypothetical protein
MNIHKLNKHKLNKHINKKIYTRFININILYIIYYFFTFSNLNLDALK